MDLAEFHRSVEKDSPPAALSPPLRALWHAVRGDWESAHTCAQEIPGGDGAWIHAHLHREEGDLGNARYWYHAADRAMPGDSIAAERARLIEVFLGR